MRSEYSRQFRRILRGYALGQYDLIQGMDWPPGIFQWLQINGLTGFLFECLSRLERPDPALSRVVREKFLAEVIRTSHYRCLLQDVSAATWQEKIPILVLKGAALWQSVYLEKPELRTVSDIDLVVRADDYQQFSRILRSLGYSGLRGGGNFYSSRGYALDVQTSLARKMEAPFTLELDAVWRRAQPVTGLPGLWVPSVEDSFVHTAIHSLKHSYLRLIWLMDLYLLAGRCAPAQLEAVSREARALQPVVYALHCLRYFGIGAGVCEDWPCPKFWERHLLNHLLTRVDNSMLGVLMIGLGLPSVKEKVRYFYKVILQDSDGVQRTVPESSAKSRVRGFLCRWIR